ncbi:MAG: S-layer homology domain-containing protein [Clostridia bacterium]|nr:S-layer homology domain-containing protein [Clostridia bacterium]
MKKLLVVILAIVVVNTKANAKFIDLEGHWAKEGIERLEILRMVSGFWDNTYRPEESVKVDQFIKMIVSINNKDVEVDKDYWAENYIKIAKKKKYIGSKEFKEYNRNITRDEVAKIVAKFLEEERVAEDKKDIKFTDSKYIENEEAVEKLITLGILTGYEDGTFRPNKSLTRAESSVIINRIIYKDERVGYVRKKTKEELYEESKNKLEETKEVVKETEESLEKEMSEETAKVEEVEETLKEKEFTDLEGHWAKNNIIELYNKKIVNGFNDGTFKPNDKLTLEQFLKMLFEAKKIKTKNETSYWAHGYIQKARELKLIETKEKYNYNLTRDELAFIVSEFLDIEGDYIDFYFDLSDIKDSKNMEHILKVYKEGIITGYEDNTFRGMNELTRAEAVVVIQRILNKDRTKPELELNNIAMQYLKNYKQNKNMPDIKNTNRYKDFDEAYIRLGKVALVMVEKSKTYINDMSYGVDYEKLKEMPEPFFKNYVNVYGVGDFADNGKVYTANEYANYLFEEIQDSKTKMVSKFYTYPGLTYITKVGTLRIRGRVYYKYINKEGISDRKLNKVYYKDLELEFVYGVEGRVVLNEIYELSDQLAGKEEMLNE